MKKSEINWENGVVTAWDVDDLDLSKSIQSQIDLLKEDLFQVRFGNNVVLDLSWHPEFNPQGQFILSVVRLRDWKHPTGDDWENPILQLKFRELSQFMQNLTHAIESAAGHASSL